MCIINMIQVGYFSRAGDLFSISMRYILFINLKNTFSIDLIETNMNSLDLKQEVKGVINLDKNVTFFQIRLI